MAAVVLATVPMGSGERRLCLAAVVAMVAAMLLLDARSQAVETLHEPAS